jgi:hypothetical protein
MNSTETKTIWNVGEGMRTFNPNETMKVLTHNPMIFWSWGVSGKIKTFGTDEYGEVKGMLLKVNGRKWKKYVLIMLNFMDWYEVHLVNEKYELVEEVGNEICFEDLVEIIDNRIETE